MKRPRNKPGEEVIGLFPTVSGRGAAAIFGVNWGTFKKALELYLHKQIRYQSTRGGFQKQFILVDVLRAAYPQASDHTIHIMAQNHVARTLEPRIARRLETERAKRLRRRAEQRGEENARSKPA